MKTWMKTLFATGETVDPNNPGKTNLISWWSLNETSGTRYDSHSSNNLSDINTVGYATGKKSNAASMNIAIPEYLSKSDNAELSTGDIDFSLCFWLKTSGTPASYASIVQKRATTPSNNREWHSWLNSGRQVVFAIYNSAGSSVGQVNSGVLSLNTWYLVYLEHNKTTNQIKIRINATTDYTAGTSGVVSDSTAAFRIGGDNTQSLVLTVDELSFMKKLLSNDEISWMYNSGNGRAYAELN
jgi:hypothetical protein